MDAIREKGVFGETSNNKGEPRRRTHSDLNEKVAQNCGEMKVCADCDDELG